MCMGGGGALDVVAKYTATTHGDTWSNLATATLATAAKPRGEADARALVAHNAGWEDDGLAFLLHGGLGGLVLAAVFISSHLPIDSRLVDVRTVVIVLAVLVSPNSGLHDVSGAIITRKVEHVAGANLGGRALLFSVAGSRRHLGRIIRCHGCVTSRRCRLGGTCKRLEDDATDVDLVHRFGSRFECGLLLRGASCGRAQGALIEAIAERKHRRIATATESGARHGEGVLEKRVWKQRPEK
mmetsp:Transcript_47530/g.124565  ORF Transcript_47530/g.124565 Transcript_47530/m.124565 type:complete len:241 (-) Transcript_47530:2-724(-)